MVSTQDHGKIDFISLDSRRDVVVLTMVEERHWGDSGLLLPDLQEKLNTYVQYVVTGRLEADYPMLIGKAVEIELRSMSELEQREQEFIEITAREDLSPLGIAFSFKQIRRQ